MMFSRERRLSHFAMTVCMMLISAVFLYEPAFAQNKTGSNKKTTQKSKKNSANKNSPKKTNTKEKQDDKKKAADKKNEKKKKVKFESLSREEQLKLQKEEQEEYKDAFTPYLSPSESLKTFELQDGYFLEPVLTDPIIKEPVIAVFDGNGRMYVAEMRTYMQDADNLDKFKPISCVSLHEDTDGDGKMDKHTIFADNLLLPRIVLPLKDSVIIGETNTLDLYEYKDTDGDGVSDTKTLVYEGGKRGGNLEHQPSGLIWAMDNWLYTTYNTYRLRYKDGKMLKESTAPNGGQWGLTQDEHGKPWYVNAGGEKGPVNFQTNITYGQFNVKEQFKDQYKIVWPIDNIPDVQGGPRRIRDDNTLNHFTATCGAEVFTGDRLPKELHGDLFFAEPVGRLIRQTKIRKEHGLSYLSNPYEAEKGEFIRSTDPNFRPVNHVTAPDGTMYMVDMYRGIIQEGNWTRRGSYLREVIMKHGLNKNIARGRIWRIRHKDHKPGKQPRMLDETPAQLVKHLAHPNGWWRNTAQKLLILHNDKSVATALKQMAQHESYLARMHALWTLEGLDLADEATLNAALSDSHPQVRLTAIRVAESLYKAGNKDIVAMIEAAGKKDQDADVIIQAMLSYKLLDKEAAKPFCEPFKTHELKGVSEIAAQLFKAKSKVAVKMSKEQKKLFSEGEKIYKTLCNSCHGEDGKGTKLTGNIAIPGLPKGVKAANTMAPSLAGSRRVTGHFEAPVNVVLHGMTGPLDNKAYTGLMVPMKSYDDKWIASVVSYVRNSFGNNAGFVTANQVKQIRNKTKDQSGPWTQETLEAAVPQLLPRKGWKLTASHNAGATKNAINSVKHRYDTGKPQKPGMWFQVQLPSAVNVAGIAMDAAKSKNDYPRGCDVRVSEDGKNWSQPLAKTKGKAAKTEIMFEPVKAKFVKVTLTEGTKSNFWSIHDLQVYGNK